MADQDIRELLTSLGRTPADISLLLSEIPISAVTNKYGPDEFSVLENVCHLRDIEVEGYAIRIKRILEEENPFLADIDGSRLAIERDYNRQNLKEALATFTSARRSNLALLEKATPAELARTGDLEMTGLISLRRLVEMMCDHDEGHLEDLDRLLRLAKLEMSES